MLSYPIFNLFFKYAKNAIILEGSIYGMHYKSFKRFELLIILKNSLVFCSFLTMRCICNIDYAPVAKNFHFLMVFN